MNDPRVVTQLLKPVRGLRLSERVAVALTEKLDSREWEPGDRLPTEHELADTFNVSRTVVREAISRLRQAGRLETVQGSGTFVASANDSSLKLPSDSQPSLQRVVQVLELRRGIEAEAAAMAARRRSQAQVFTMREHLALPMRATNTLAAAAEGGLRLHRLIAEATGNPLYVTHLEFLLQHLGTQTRLGLPVPDPQRASEAVAQIQEEHHLLVDAIAEGDAGRARREAIRHLLNAELRLRNAHRQAQLVHRDIVAV